MYDPMQKWLPVGMKNSQFNGQNKHNCGKLVRLNWDIEENFAHGHRLLLPVCLCSCTCGQEIGHKVQEGNDQEMAQSRSSKTFKGR